MALNTDNARVGRPPYGVEAQPLQLDADALASGVSWGAILAGAAGAAALSLVLLLLGTGLGLTTVSPWSGQGAGATAIGAAAIGWLSFTQLAASGVGGYLAGRLRGRWSGVQVDEVYFRDTAHGFLAWSVATLFTAAVLGSAVGAIAGAGARAGATIAGGAAAAAGAGGAAAAASTKGGSQGSEEGAGMLGYYTDALFRRDPASQTAAAPTPDAAANGAEVGRIFLNGLRHDALPAEDADRVAQLVAQRTGLSQDEANKRVQVVYAKAQTELQQAQAKAREAADAARKASAYAALWLVVSLFVGAFVASLAATYGGRRRDA